MISFVICSADPTKASGITLHLKSILPPDSYELLLIRDARSLCEGYNRGFVLSRGDFLVFMHDDVAIMSTQLVPRLLAHLQTYDLIGVAGTNHLIRGGNWVSAGPPYIFGQIAHPLPHGFRVNIYAAPTRAVGGMQALDGVFLGCKRAVVEAVPFDEQIFDGFHCYDLDFTFRAYRAGFQLGVCYDIPVFHDSNGTFDENFLKYLARFETKHQEVLPYFPKREFKYAGVTVQSLAEILEVMRCPGLNPSICDQAQGAREARSEL